MHKEVIGTTQSGKSVIANQEPNEYADFSRQDHEDASLVYNDRRVKYRLTDKAHDRSLDLEHKHHVLSRK